ncbi:Chromosome transmission fidelity protein 8 family-containing protein [Strongyloides ratti]|uniref:Chromosome transmission fidelity protein 8 family-containing protein n=1 Tax=Strongyloides ratti TaxID=34506 RepID=A0A090MXA0_STRRB|nr:Chromosome transmission fidelity protein 8 family-containing protein [Strongyloides ratti]CEF65069.1 Chromosome transmission fidelity protein 8 family-containing protein [Strongyloides ratti]
MQIKLIRNEAGIQEWIIMEFTGTFKSDEFMLNGLSPGSVVWRKKEESIVMVTGHTILEGGVKKLEKPLLVLDKCRYIPNNDSPDNQVKVVGVIKRKIVFTSRPRPIVTRTYELLVWLFLKKEN